MTIKELKEKYDAETSEELFGIDEQPEESCPKIDEGIRNCYNIQRDIETYCKNLQRCDNIDEVKEIANDIEWAIRNLDVEENYEYLRNQCQKIRSWGQGWKDFAKKLIEERNDVTELINQI